jgi:hypothetical protein
MKNAVNYIKSRNGIDGGHYKSISKSQNKNSIDANSNHPRFFNYNIGINAQ